MKFFLTVPKTLNIAVLFSIIILISKIILFNNIPEIFGYAHEIGLMFEAILASMIASYVFYLIVVHVKDFKDNKIIYPVVIQWANRVVGDCTSQLKCLSKASSVDLNLNQITKVDLKTALGAINPNNQAPLMLSNHNKHRYANWIEYMLYYQSRTQHTIENLFTQMIFLDSDLILKLINIDNCSHYGQLKTMGNSHIANKDMMFMNSTFYDYCICCKELKKTINRISYIYG